MIDIDVCAAQRHYGGSMNVLPRRGPGSMSAGAAIGAKRNCTRSHGVAFWVIRLERLEPLSHNGCRHIDHEKGETPARHHDIAVTKQWCRGGRRHRHRRAAARFHGPPSVFDSVSTWLWRYDGSVIGRITPAIAWHEGHSGDALQRLTVAPQHRTASRAAYLSWAASMAYQVVMDFLYPSGMGNAGTSTSVNRPASLCSWLTKGSAAVPTWQP